MDEYWHHAGIVGLRLCYRLRCGREFLPCSRERSGTLLYLRFFFVKTKVSEARCSA